MMNSKTMTAALALAAMGLSACDGHGDRMVNTKICADFSTAANSAQPAATPITPADAASPVDECVRRWSYSLAGSPDRADIVANAAVAACGAALTRWSQAALSQPSQDAANGPDALSLTTGMPTNAVAEHSAFAHGRALLYVVEARAGRCAPHPVANGVPVGT
jgi:hypothetical protein